ncbi:MAG: metal-binding protein [Rhodoferax ferrireducens]|uniref:Metal-binding protein n=1 Tax=Rhodoferax ferrireducens TaxID=192843 RepID=A0A1W9KR63_9BURK|nr:MAG: metal-binding protein [Rhodoferax ferrireducens]
MQRRTLIQSAVALLGAAALPTTALSQNVSKPMVDVWKTSTCGCCKDWVKHLQDSGFEVKTHDVSEAAKATRRSQLGLAEKYGSCHTALVGGYVVEGHVPAQDIRKLLKERPRALGLSVPGMPIGSPGMDGPAYDGRKDAYAVLLVQRDGSSSVYQKYA